MAIFYRGAGIGTYWYENDPIEQGFIAREPEMDPTTSRLMDHIARGTVNSPFISVTRSYGVAWNYAMSSGTQDPTRDDPAYVYEIEIPESPIAELIDELQSDEIDRLQLRDLLRGETSEVQHPRLQRGETSEVQLLDPVKEVAEDVDVSGKPGTLLPA